MALTKADVAMWDDLKSRRLIPDRPQVLEIGQANWYGDVPPHPDDDAPAMADGSHLFEIARRFYRRMMPGCKVEAVDKHGPNAAAVDLNEPQPFVASGGANVVINTGTAEHVFNQARLFETIHDACAGPKEIRGDIPFDLKPLRIPGGLMIHAAPLGGWHNHGFYNYHPTFWADLGAANGYELLYLAHFDFTRGEVTRLGAFRDVVPGPADSMLYVVFRKTRGDAFVVPMQGRYAGATPTEVRA